MTKDEAHLLDGAWRKFERRLRAIKAARCGQDFPNQGEACGDMWTLLLFQGSPINVHLEAALTTQLRPA